MTNPPLFVALNGETWVNVNNITAVSLGYQPNECTVTVGKVKYAVRCSARDFLKRIDEART